jgi:hypothetical protein
MGALSFVPLRSKNAGQQSQLNSAVGPTATALGPHSGDGKSGGVGPSRVVIVPLPARGVVIPRAFEASAIW